MTIMPRIIYFTLAVILILALLFLSGYFSQQETATESKLAPSELPFELGFENLQQLGSGSYELWLVRGDKAWSFGRFQTNIAGNGFAAGTQLSEVTTKPQDGDQIMVTLESEQETNNQPSEVTVLIGLIGANQPAQAELRYPIDLSGATGSYVLGTPTNDPEGFETAGVWFTDPTGANPSLVLPDLPAGWAYEIWVEHRDLLLSGGLFMTPSQADDFAGFSGDAPGPNYPGEDYVRNLPAPFKQPLDLADGDSRVFVSLEPYLDGVDPSDLPSATPTASRFLTILSALISANAQDHTTYALESFDQQLPQGSIKLVD